MTKRETFPDMEIEPSQWVGRTQETWGALTTNFAGMMDASVAHALSAARDLRPGAPMPCLWHWAAFPEFVPHAELGRDGHPKLGGFLPPLRFPRRMWAGGKLAFHGQLRIGERLRKRSEILSVTEKVGATGPMAFVKVKHLVEGENSALIEEEQDIVYLDIPDTFRAPKKLPVPEGLDFDEAVVMDAARLFRFSAVTFNAHRIHYDLPYAQDVEKYPALVVHGPMQAIMLIEAAKRHTGRAPRHFKFRGLHPMFHDHAFHLTGKADVAGRAIDLGTADPGPDGPYIGLQARMEWDA